mgnify:CR=1 FL=1
MRDPKEQLQDILDVIAYEIHRPAFARPIAAFAQDPRIPFPNHAHYPWPAFFRLSIPRKISSNVKSRT